MNIPYTHTHRETHTARLFKGLSLSQIVDNLHRLNIYETLVALSSKEATGCSTICTVQGGGAGEGRGVGVGETQCSISLPHSALSGRGRPIQSACESHQSHHSSAAPKAFAIVKSREKVFKVAQAPRRHPVPPPREAQNARQAQAQAQAGAEVAMTGRANELTNCNDLARIKIL